MSKKQTLISLLAVTSVVVILISWQLLKSNRKPESLSSPTANQSAVISSETSALIKEVIYEDPSGFSFKYPEDWEVTDDTPDDNVHYAAITLSKDDQRMSVVIKDTKYKRTNDWLLNLLRITN